MSQVECSGFPSLETSSALNLEQLEPLSDREEARLFGYDLVTGGGGGGSTASSFSLLEWRSPALRRISPPPPNLPSSFLKTFKDSSRSTLKKAKSTGEKTQTHPCVLTCFATTNTKAGFGSTCGAKLESRLESRNRARGRNGKLCSGDIWEKWSKFHSARGESSPLMLCARASWQGAPNLQKRP